MKLFKISEPDWTKEFNTKLELQTELYINICRQCCAEDGITEISDIGTMLATACGCEFDVELT